MANEIIESAGIIGKPTFDDVVENLLRIIDTYEIRQKVEIISRISDSILQQENEASGDSELEEVFGSWDEEESSEELIERIYSARVQTEREIEF
ncbi:MAG: hypothetical protein H7A25_18085 [Leptospiraceae bacterium]|nr:hypothetical protein [Leptospiraceae bacterium]MCP5501817.1 hypothetical protein [Leptospiraceae bacterium]